MSRAPLELSRTSPKICLSLTEPTLRENLSILERVGSQVDLAELRVDFLDDAELSGLKGFPAATKLPMVLVYRRRRDGGHREVEESLRVSILESALEGAWAFIDLEEDLHAPRLDRIAADRAVRIIRSFHDFDGVPPNLSERLRRLARDPEELPKVAVMPRSLADLLRILDAGDAIAAAPAVVVGMGEWGFPTRVLPGRFSSVWSYATAGERKAAPGHVDPATLRRTYRLGEVSSSASIYCIAGNPVHHSRSPWIHNPAFRALGIDAVYVPIQVDELGAFFELADRLSVRGASVTVPHKERVREFLSRSDESVRSIGACNTLVRESAGWSGYNTDANGFIAPLVSRFGGALAGKKVLVIGAGGAARAAVYALITAGCDVTVVNRTDRRAAELASQFGCSWISASGASGRFEIVVQATSVGMTPHVEDDPLPSWSFEGSELVYELIYAPERTRFLERAHAAGCATIGGREMLLGQAYAQFRLFTGREYPTEIGESSFSS
ncbi:MAG TPA: shikimate dehydrogenase [Spirochaetia bacterium]|nr:shikimate dehydrogenase [Spirochaetia bacterium]